jgi:hypothetical protein
VERCRSLQRQEQTCNKILSQQLEQLYTSVAVQEVRFTPYSTSIWWVIDFSIELLMKGCFWLWKQTKHCLVSKEAMCTGGQGTHPGINNIHCAQDSGQDFAIFSSFLPGNHTWKHMGPCHVSFYKNFPAPAVCTWVPGSLASTFLCIGPWRHVPDFCSSSFRLVLVLCCNL